MINQPRDGQDADTRGSKGTGKGPRGSQHRRSEDEKQEADEVEDRGNQRQHTSPHGHPIDFMTS